VCIVYLFISAVFALRESLLSASGISAVASVTNHQFYISVSDHILSGIAGPGVDLWSSAVAFIGPSFSLCRGWSEAFELLDSLATWSKMLEGAVSSAGWAGMLEARMCLFGEDGELCKVCGLCE